jgi:hypothetical protein
MQKAGLEGEVARLQRQRDAHFDDQLNVRRQIRNTSADRLAAEKRIACIRQDIGRRVTTRGDAFALTWDDRVVTERRTAGALILSKLRLTERAGKDSDFPLGRLGGFELRCAAGRGFVRAFEASLILVRTEYDQEVQVEADLTPTGLIARLEHLLDRFDLDLQEQDRRGSDAAVRLAGYEQRTDQPFPLQVELDGKLHQLNALEADLAQTGKKTA